MTAMNKTVGITAVWLRSTGGETGQRRAEVLVEINGEWHLAITENLEGPFSHIAEGNGADHWPLEVTRG